MKQPLCNHIELKNEHKYCPNCGAPLNLDRIDMHYVQHEIEHFLHFEKGFLFTVKELLIRPGATIQAFIKSDRSRIVKPIAFLFITSILYTLITSVLPVDLQYTKVESNLKALTTMNNWMQKNYGYMNLLMGVFVTWAIKLFFKKYNYTFFEILVMVCFITGITMFFYAVFGIIEAFTGISSMVAGGVVGLIYAVWATAQFFDKTRWQNYLKALGANLIGYLIFIFGFSLVGVIAELIINRKLG